MLSELTRLKSKNLLNQKHYAHQQLEDQPQPNYSRDEPMKANGIFKRIKALDWVSD